MAVARGQRHIHGQFSFLFVSRLQAGAPLTEGVEVALDPSELELDPAAMQARWERYLLTFCYSQSCAIVILGGWAGWVQFEFKRFEKLQRVCVMFFKGAWASVRCWNMVTKVEFLFDSRYEQQLKERESQLQKEDLSDMVAEHAAKQKVPVH